MHNETWADKWHQSKYPPHLPPTSPIFICWAWNCMVWDIPWVIWGQLSGLGSLPLLVHPQHPCWCGGVRSRKVLTLCEHSAISKKISIINVVLVTNRKHSLLIAMRKKINSLSTKTSLTYQLDVFSYCVLKSRQYCVPNCKPSNTVIGSGTNSAAVLRQYK